MLRTILVASLSAWALSDAAAVETGPTVCPPFGAAVCAGQKGTNGRPCGQKSHHSLAYALRVGHLAYDWVSGLLYNPGKAGLADHKKWQWFEAPDPEDIDAWCLEACSVVRADPKPRRRNRPCTEGPVRAAPPPQRPPEPAVIRCFMGDDLTGGIEWEKYPNCPGAAAAAAFQPDASIMRKPRPPTDR